MFPTFALVSHYIVGTERTTGDLKRTILFGMWSLVPYFAYLVSLYLLVDRHRLATAMLIAVSLWVCTALVLVVAWKRVSGL